MSVTILEGDVLDRLADLPDEAVNCIVTSPPYFGQRDYGVIGQIGQEKTPSEYVAKMVQVFGSSRRVLRKDGCLWLNLGFSYASAWPCSRRSIIGEGSLENGKRENRPARLHQFKEKDLMPIPWMVAMALQADGWWLRQWMPWVKRQAMPESTKDRPTSACEVFFLLTRSEKYAYDYDAVKRQAAIPADSACNSFARIVSGGERVPGLPAQHRADRTDKQRGHSRRHAGFNDRWDQMDREEQGANGRAFRNSDLFFDSIDAPHGAITDTEGEIIALDMGNQGTRIKHYATYPPRLIKPLILAGCPSGGTVLDPFLGSGTTVAVALELGRNGIGIELNPTYAEFARTRIAAVTPGMDFSQPVMEGAL